MTTLRYHCTHFLCLVLALMVELQPGRALVSSPFMQNKKFSSLSLHQRNSFKRHGLTTTTNNKNHELFFKNPSLIILSAMDNGDNSSQRQPTPSNNLPFWLDPGTRGGAIVLSVILFIVPLVAYSVATNLFGVDGVDAGKWIGVGFTAGATLLWVITYIFRVATKDMTYAKQLKDYENAVIAKRLEELDDDEIQALVEEIERDEF